MTEKLKESLSIGIATEMVATLPRRIPSVDVISACAYITAFAMRDMPDDERAQILQWHIDQIKDILAATNSKQSGPH